MHMENRMNIISRNLIRTTCLFCTITLTACGGGSDSDSNDEYGQLADSITNELTEPVPTPNESDPVPLFANSSATHLSAANQALRESLSADVQALLPDDCLLEVGGAVYCYSVSTRTLMAVLRSRASVYWQFELPGSDMAYTNGIVPGDGVNTTSVSVSRSLNAIGDITSNKSLSMLIDPPLFRPYIYDTTGLSGGMSLTASDGSSVMISARNAQSGLGEELDLTFGSGTSLVRPFESLVRPWIDR